MPNTALAHLLAAHRDALVQQFVERVYATTVPQSVDRERAADSAGTFLDELVERLREPDASRREPHASASGSEHGAQRFRMGYDIGTVVREYAVLEAVIFDLLEAHERSSVRVQRIVTDHLLAAIADAVTTYAARRDEELQKQSEGHLAFLAHELRNPLGSVSLAFGLAKSTGDIRDTRATVAIARGLAALRTLIDGALVRVTMRQGAEIALGAIDLKQLLEDVALDSEPESAAKGVAIRVVAVPITIRGDQRLLRSALSNLTRNAVKFSAPDGAVEIRAKRAGSRVTIEVEDCCGGLPPGSVEKIFDPYVQTGHDRTGFGLGLAIAKQAAQAHGGDVRALDLPGKGCVFVLDLPVDPSPGG